MSDSGKRWEDEPSTQGLGLLQSALGIPNSPLYTKGELSLKKQQEIIDATKALTSGISKRDMRVVATDPYTQTEVLERVGEHIREGFESTLKRQMDEYSYREWEREKERMEIENREAERERENRAQVQRQAAIIGNEIKEVRRGIGNVNIGISDINSHLAPIKFSASSIDKGVTRVANTLDKVTRGQALQTEYLEQIQETINSCSRDTNSLLEDLKDLAIANIHEQVEQHEITREVIKEAFEKAVGAVIFAIELMAEQISSRLDIINGHLSELNQTGRDIYFAIRENTATVNDVAHRSEEIRAVQYRKNGLNLFNSGLYKDALSKLLESHSYLADFETSLLLAQTYIKLNRYAQAFETLIGAHKLARRPEEEGRSKAVHAQLLKITGEEESTDMAMKALLVYPPALYSELQGFWRNKEDLFAMLKDLRTQNMDNPNALGLCLVEFCKVGDSDLTEEALEDLNRAFTRGMDKPLINEEIMNDAFPHLSPLLKDYLKKKRWKIAPEMCFWIAKILLERDEKTTDARMLLTEGIRNDVVIKDFLKKRDYSSIVQYLQFKIGHQIIKLKDYYEIPASIRNLI